MEISDISSEGKMGGEEEDKRAEKQMSCKVIEG